MKNRAKMSSTFSTANFAKDLEMVQAGGRAIKEEAEDLYFKISVPGCKDHIIERFLVLHSAFDNLINAIPPGDDRKDFMRTMSLLPNSDREDVAFHWDAGEYFRLLAKCMQYINNPYLESRACERQDWRSKIHEEGPKTKNAVALGFISTEQIKRVSAVAKYVTKLFA